MTIADVLDDRAAFPAERLGRMRPIRTRIVCRSAAAIGNLGGRGAAQGADIFCLRLRLIRLGFARTLVLGRSIHRLKPPQQLRKFV